MFVRLNDILHINYKKYTQDEVANRAAISRSTLSLAERGENIAINNLVKILRVLDALYVFEQFRAAPKISPLQFFQQPKVLISVDEQACGRGLRVNKSKFPSVNTV
jgi:transcriptional regulator with XRE-family HTH domain